MIKAAETFEITGLGGEKRLSGTLSVNGAKNAALKAMAAAVLFDGPVRLENIPDTDDIRTMSGILENIGTKVRRPERSVPEIDASKELGTDIDPAMARMMRASVVLTGPL